MYKIALILAVIILGIIGYSLLQIGIHALGVIQQVKL